MAENKYKQTQKESLKENSSSHIRFCFPVALDQGSSAVNPTCYREALMMRVWHMIDHMYAYDHMYGITSAHLHSVYLGNVSYGERSKIFSM